jgi:hypothetical protein
MTDHLTLVLALQLSTTTLMFGVQEPMSPPVSTPLGYLVLVLLLLALLSPTTQLSSFTLIVVVMPRTTPLDYLVMALPLPLPPLMMNHFMFLAIRERMFHAFCLAPPSSPPRTDTHFAPACCEAAEEHTSKIDWKKIKQRITLDCHPSLASTSRTIRQATGNYADYGFCTSQNSNRNGSSTGHAMPGLKPNSRLLEIVDAFVALTSFAKHTQPSWRPNGSHFALFDPDVLSEFAHKIDGDNFIPSLHIARTSATNPCGCHNDGATNSKSHQDVVCISVVVNQERISCNAQQRKSIDDYQTRCSECGEPLLATEKVYREMDVSRRSVTHALFEGKQVEYVPGFGCMQNECNMDPTSYIMLVLSCIVKLGLHFDLNLPELHSVQMAFQVFPHSCMFFGVATETLLHLNPSQIPSTYRRGYGFGHLLANLIVDLFLLTREALILWLGRTAAACSLSPKLVPSWALEVFTSK